MRIGATIQARMSSRRLPGKVLRPLGGRPMLNLVIERLRKSDAVEIVVVATSTGPDDDAIERFCSSEGVPCFRGELDDVSSRLLATADAFGFDAIVRISGDSPLIDPEIVDLGVDEFTRADADVATNVFPRRMCPFGQSVEVLARPALERALPLMTEPGDREHVTPAFYRHADSFAIHSFDLGEDLSGPSFIVDQPADAAMVEVLLDRMDRPHTEYSIRDLLALRESVLAEPGAMSR